MFAGEWECISGQSSHGITVVHEATEKVKRNLGKIRVMRNHTFACSEFLGNDITDETLYERAASQLTSQATLGVAGVCVVLHVLTTDWQVKAAPSLCMG